MLTLLSAAGRSFLRAFLASLLVLGVGVADAPDLHRAYLVGVAAVLGSLAAGIRSFQAYVPQVSLVVYLGHPFGDWADSFLRAFLSTLIVTLPPVLGAPDLDVARALEVGVVVGAFTAVVRALQGLLTVSESPAPHLGLAEPPLGYSYQAPRRVAPPAP